MNRKKGKGILFIVSAPSGAGKTTLCKMAVDFFSDLRHSVSYTTRPPRDGEINGIDYNFVTQETFDKMFKNKEFLECAEVHGYKYGTSIKDLHELIARGLDVMLDIDVQGARQVKDSEETQNFKKVFIFIMPPSIEVCEERLKNRGKDDTETIKKRVENARKEITKSIWYDYNIVNDDLETAFEEFKSIIHSVISRTAYRASEQSRPRSDKGEE
ncbi:MAG: guanylate kinase [Deltaproteobacteria bacterium]|nr:guanylate kinase [Deltaproteobacteria bacterium]